MGEFVRILKISKIASVSLQLLQTISIMIQNLRNEHAICKLILRERRTMDVSFGCDRVIWIMPFLLETLQIICSATSM